jgi:hypothetical protein
MLPPGTASSGAPQALQIQVVLNWFEAHGVALADQEVLPKSLIGQNLFIES